MLENTKWSYWERENFVENIDYLIVGAGIVGYSAALALRKKHPAAKIIILERGNLPSGASSKNAGFACFGSVTEVYDDIQKFGDVEVWNTVDLRWRGLQNLRSLIGDENLDLQIHGSWDLITKDEIEIYEASLPYLKEYNEHLEAITGEKNVYSVDNRVAEKFGFKQVETSFHNRMEGQIDTGKMNQAFYQKVVKKGIRILFGTEVLSIDEGNDHAIARTNIGDFTARNIAVCTNGFASQLINEDVAPARAQVLITKPIPNLRIEGTFHYQQGYYYFRNIHDRILFGGGRHLDKLGETTTEMEISPIIMAPLEELLRTVILPSVAVEIDYRWAGIMGVGSAKKPIIKRVSPSIYCGVRLGGMGVAIGSLIGNEIAALITTSESD